jgi:hypothetical protein
LKIIEATPLIMKSPPPPFPNKKLRKNFVFSVGAQIRECKGNIIFDKWAKNAKN